MAAAAEPHSSAAVGPSTGNRTSGKASLRTDVATLITLYRVDSKRAIIAASGAPDATPKKVMTPAAATSQPLRSSPASPMLEATTTMTVTTAAKPSDRM